LGRTTAGGTIFDPATQRAVGARQLRHPFPNNHDRTMNPRLLLHLTLGWETMT
jgi:hypothetical protein